MWFPARSRGVLVGTDRSSPAHGNRLRRGSRERAHLLREGAGKIVHLRHVRRVGTARAECAGKRVLPDEGRAAHDGKAVRAENIPQLDERIVKVPVAKEHHRKRPMRRRPAPVPSETAAARRHAPAYVGTPKITSSSVQSAVSPAAPAAGVKSIADSSAPSCCAACAAMRRTGLFRGAGAAEIHGMYAANLHGASLLKASRYSSKSSFLSVSVRQLHRPGRDALERVIAKARAVLPRGDDARACGRRPDRLRWARPSRSRRSAVRFSCETAAYFSPLRACRA